MPSVSTSRGRTRRRRSSTKRRSMQQDHLSTGNNVRWKYGWVQQINLGSISKFSHTLPSTYKIISGICRQFRPAADVPAISNPCDRVFCPTGYFCQSTTGSPAQLSLLISPLGTCLASPQRDDPCTRLTCPQGTSCDTNSGLCRQFRPAADQPAIPSINICANMYCPSGTFCNPNTGSCEGYVRDPNAPECPANSHYEQCTSPCPYSCTSVGERCQWD